MNIVSNFIPHETVICGNRVTQVNTRIKNLINDKKVLFKKIIIMAKTHIQVFEEFKLLQIKIINLTNDSRDKYFFVL